MTERKQDGPRNPVEILDTLLEHAVDEETDRRPSRSEDEWASRIAADVRSKIAARRHRRMPTPPPARRATRIPEEILLLGRDALIAQLELRRRSGARLAHLDLVGLTTNDLQLALAEFIALEQSRS